MRFNPINKSRLQGALIHAVTNQDSNEARNGEALAKKILSNAKSSDIPDIKDVITTIVSSYCHNRPDACEKLLRIFEVAGGGLEIDVDWFTPSQAKSSQFESGDFWEDSHPWDSDSDGFVEQAVPGEKISFSSVGRYPEVLVATRLSAEDVVYFMENGRFPSKPIFACHSFHDFDEAFTQAYENSRGKPYFAFLRFKGGRAAPGMGDVQDYHEENFEGGAKMWWYEPSQKSCEEAGFDIAFGDNEEDYFMAIVCNHDCVEVDFVASWEGYRLARGIEALSQLATGKVREDDVFHLAWKIKVIPDIQTEEGIGSIFYESELEGKELVELAQDLITNHPQAAIYYSRMQEAYEYAKVLANTDAVDLEMLFRVKYIWNFSGTDVATVKKECRKIVSRGISRPKYRDTGAWKKFKGRRDNETQQIIAALDTYGLRYRNHWIIGPMPFRTGYVCRVISPQLANKSPHCDWQFLPIAPTEAEAIRRAKAYVDRIAGNYKVSLDSDQAWAIAFPHAHAWVENEVITQIRPADYDREVGFLNKTL